MKFFMMSKRFNRQTCEEFGLTRLENGKFYNREDGSFWRQHPLFNFGWGPEFGFVRFVEFSFQDLINLAVNDKDDDNRYGALALIIDEYQNSLLLLLEESIVNNQFMKYKFIYTNLRLDRPVNHTFRIGQTQKTIEDNFKRWKKISEHIKNISK